MGGGGGRGRKEGRDDFLRVPAVEVGDNKVHEMGPEEVINHNAQRNEKRRTG